MISESISVAIVDDHLLFRKVLQDFLCRQTRININIQASNLNELFAKLKYSKIQVLVTDLFMPQPDVFEALDMLNTIYPELRILILSMCTDLTVISSLLDLGIHGYISKSEEPEVLVDAIFSVSANKIYRNSLFIEALLHNRQTTKKNRVNGTQIQLNEREIRILELLWEEKSNKEIAEEIFLSVRSVEKIRQDMKDKVGVKSTVGLFKYAIEKKIIGNRTIKF